MKKVFFLCCIASLLCACATASVGRPIDQNAVNQIEQGKTTKAQVLALIGSPDRITEVGDGSSHWMYLYARSAMRLGGHDSQSQVVMIMFDKDSIVNNITKSYGGMEVNTGASASSRIDQPAVEENKRPK